MRKILKPSDLNETELVNALIKLQIRKEREIFPKLKNEPLTEYKEHLHCEVESNLIDLIKNACTDKFGSYRKDWRDC